MADLQIKSPIRLIELFGGVGTQAMALERMGVPFEHYRLVEFDKYCVKSYNAIHGTDFVPTDITEIHADDLGITDRDKYTYLMFFSWPCQSLSVAGKMAGMSYEDWKKGNKTRSSLLFEVCRLLQESIQKGESEGDRENYLPQILCFENVTQVHSKKNMADFQVLLDFLSDYGYEVKWQDMNAKDYGIPQSRNRTLGVAYLRSEFPGQTYTFPEPIPLTYAMDHALLPEESVEDKFYVKGDRIDRILDELVEKYGDRLEDYLSKEGPE
jgi:DNA (cytosine-5)-methyltransferase 1